MSSRASAFVYANREENFVKAFPLQYPYGVGGPSQLRLNKKGENCQRPFIDYVKHVNNLSNRNFHTPHFTIMTWNITQKLKMLDGASLKVKNDNSLLNVALT